MRGPQCILLDSTMRGPQCILLDSTVTRDPDPQKLTATQPEEESPSSSGSGLCVIPVFALCVIPVFAKEIRNPAHFRTPWASARALAHGWKKIKVHSIYCALLSRQESPKAQQAEHLTCRQQPYEGQHERQDEHEEQARRHQRAEECVHLEPSSKRALVE